MSTTTTAPTAHRRCRRLGALAASVLTLTVIVSCGNRIDEEASSRGPNLPTTTAPDVTTAPEITTAPPSSELPPVVPGGNSTVTTSDTGPTLTLPDGTDTGFPTNVTLPDGTTITFPDLPNAKEAKQCATLAIDYAQLFLGAIAGTLDKADATDILDRLNKAAPADVKDDIAVIADALNRLDGAGILDRIHITSDQKVVDANDAITTWLTDACKKASG